MTRDLSTKAMAIAGTLTLTFCAGAVYAQQQFGPSPQAMYKQHPGSAPTYVSYGVASMTPSIAAANARMTANTSSRSTATTAKPSGAKTSTSVTASRRRTATPQSTKGSAGM